MFFYGFSSPVEAPAAEHLERAPASSSPQQQKQQTQQCGGHFGRSLLADVSDHYMSDFVLQGTNDESMLLKLHQDLRHSVTCSVLDEHISESVCLVADTDKW